jgi:hypothetical protein
MPDEQLAPYFAALQSEEPTDELFRLVIEFKKAGGTKDEALQLLERFREQLGCNTKDGDERIDDIILDVMDSIAGWCRPEQNIYSAGFDEKTFWEDREATMRYWRARNKER